MTKLEGDMLANLMPRMRLKQVNQMEAGQVFVEDVRKAMDANCRRSRGKPLWCSALTLRMLAAAIVTLTRNIIVHSTYRRTLRCVKHTREINRESSTDTCSLARLENNHQLPSPNDKNYPQIVTMTTRIQMLAFVRVQETDVTTGAKGALVVACVEGLRSFTHQIKKVSHMPCTTVGTHLRAANQMHNPFEPPKLRGTFGICWMHPNYHNTQSSLYHSTVEKFSRGALMHHRCE
ncbi:hypothetical protein GOBAR_DD04008 [Gossypium barbadense]|nr:hypothetical protein GOBAR_DD04008 [Gossypium barbadense]